jgi:hypothetical protein
MREVEGRTLAKDLQLRLLKIGQLVDSMHEVEKQAS